MTSSLRSAVVAALARVELQPVDARAWSDLAVAFLEAGQPEGARAASDRALRLSPRCAGAWMVRVQLARRRGAHAEAVHLARQALEACGDQAALWGTLGGALWALGELEEAARAHRRAGELEPENIGHCANLATVLTALGDGDAALQALAQALAQAPEEPRLRTNRAMALLGAGDFARGFVEHEHRLRRPGVRPLPGPSWTGEPLSGTLLVVAEQGFGDAIQWARFLPRLQGRADRVVVAVHPRLHQLFSALPGVDGVVDRRAAMAGELPEGTAGVVALMSLPAVLGEDGSTLAQELPLWTVPTDQLAAWRERLGPGLAVALAWSGNPTYPMDHLRSAPLSALRPLGALPGLRLVAVQKQHGRASLGTPRAPAGLLDLGPELDTGPDAFVDTMAVMAAAGLVLTTDTATAHLAGSLGCETWLLLSRPADWRWPTSGQICPWYPTMRIFRQHRAGDWGGVVAAVLAALQERIGPDAAQEAS